jgi:hypothetical protein
MKTAQQLVSKKLLQCSRCRTAQYCSADCQRANWPVHKLLCQPALLLTNLIRESHHEYLRYLGNLSLVHDKGVSGFDAYINGLTQKLDTLIQSSSENEKSLLAHYKAYITAMVHDLYSPKKQYAQVRKLHNVSALEGFLAFATMIQKKYAE